MSVEQMITSMIEGFKSAADISTVFGEPMTFYDKTLIPIARVGYGLGAGEGKGVEGAGGSGGGGGGGTEPVGFLLVTKDEVRFIPLAQERHRAQPQPAAMVVPAVMVGLIAATMIARRRRRAKAAPER
ncbi:MAG: spore germination protein GerW family protein [Chloroflexota bacterium]|nr:spore germination protein GerW family protein [Chloroflexota bacterium]